MTTKTNTKPIEVKSTLVTAEHPDQVLKILDTYGVAVIGLTAATSEIKAALKATKFYNTANAI